MYRTSPGVCLINQLETGHRSQTPAWLKGKRAPRVLFLPGSVSYPATSCITCCLNHPHRFTSMPGTRMGQGIILSPFALKPMESQGYSGALFS